jgi:hypothetical protein
MGTTLTGTTPQDTYDSLIKVTDNGPISGTAKFLSDGLGNDSALALSTTALGIGTTSLSGTFHAQATNSGIFFDLTTAYTPKIKAAGAISDLQIESVGSGGNLILGAGGATSIMQFFTNGNSSTGERMRITSAGNVGIGTSAPNFILETAGTTGIGVRSTGVDGVYTDILSSVYSGNANEQNAIQASVSGVASDSGFRFQVSDGSGLTTQTLGYQLNKDRHVFYTNGSERVRVTTSGLTFNGDTAAANALDDYEEGTWTVGASFGGASVGIVTFANLGTYTKIGRQVTVNGRISFTNKGSSTGLAAITGLPFTVANTEGNWSSASFRFNRITFATQMQSLAVPNTTTFVFTQTNGVTGVSADLTDANFANNTEIQFSLTYFTA